MTLDSTTDASALCPFCHQEVPIGSHRCKHCDTVFQPGVALTEKQAVAYYLVGNGRSVSATAREMKTSRTAVRKHIAAAKAKLAGETTAKLISMDTDEIDIRQDIRGVC